MEDTWSLFFVAQETIEESTTSHIVTNVYNAGTIGSSNSVVGVHKILATLDLLNDWIATDFTTWIQMRLDSLVR